MLADSRRSLRVMCLLAACVAADAARASARDVFTLTGSPTRERSSHAAAPLADGRVIVVGGWGSEHGFSFAVATAEVYDPATATFAPTGSMAQARIGPNAVTLPSGQVLVAGGWGPVAQGGYRSLASAELYEPASGTFSSVGGMGTGRQSMTATLLADGTVLVAGGTDDFFSWVASAEIFDPSAGTFSPAGSMSRPRSHHTATLLRNGRVLITSERTAELYDPATRSFSPTGDMSTYRTVERATLLDDGRVLVVGQGGSADVYDPGTGTFAAVGPTLSDRNGATATLLQTGSVLIAGGYQLRTSELYEPASDTFLPAAALREPRAGHTATLLADGTVLVVGGTTAELYHASGYEDTVAPTIHVPADITTVAWDASGALVFYDVSVADDVDSYPPPASCAPASGSLFPVGDTTIACEAADRAGNTATASFRVSVVASIDIAVSLDAKFAMDSRTGLVTVSGTVACNRSTFVSLSGQLTQVVANRAVLHGAFFAWGECVAPEMRWTATVAALTGSFGAGAAEATVSASSCELGCDFDQTDRSVRLVGKGR